MKKIIVFLAITVPVIVLVSILKSIPKFGPPFTAGETVYGDDD